MVAVLTQEAAQRGQTLLLEPRQLPLSFREVSCPMAPSPRRGQGITGGAPRVLLPQPPLHSPPPASFHKARRRGPDLPETIHSLPLSEPHSFPGRGWGGRK